MLNVLFSARPEQWDEYAPLLRAAFERAGIQANLSQTHAPETVDYIVFAPSGGLRDFTPFVKCRAVLSLWAGVEQIVDNETLTQPLCRMVDSGLTQGMVEWVVGHVMRHHLNIDWHIHNQAKQIWDDTPPPLARDRRICVLGLGALGAACAQALARLGFPVSGWARREKQIDGVACYAGPYQLEMALSGGDILVLLLPLTPATENLMDVDRLSKLPKGAVILNPGRGPLIDDQALLASLDQGHISHATLDVFRQEPVPQNHPFWTHPNVTVTPHIASATRANTASEVIVDNILRDQNGQPLLHQVDRALSY